MACMKCPEKEGLQQKCTAKWNDYVAAISESNLSIDPSLVRQKFCNDIGVGGFAF